jgi:hypothetical protein
LDGLPAQRSWRIRSEICLNAIRGRLKAAKAADGTWRSSKVWVDEFTAARYKRE